MINGKTYYQILGVQPDAEDIVIKAAYRALAQRYHPDKWSGDPRVATERMGEINRSYEVLSSINSRQEYDREINQSGKANEFPDSEVERDAFQEYFSDRTEEWEYAKKYFPELDHYFDSLKAVNINLAFEYRLVLLETKHYKDAKSIHDKIRSEFLSRYFGSEPAVLKVVEKFLRQGRKDALLEINKALRLLGPSFDATKVLRELESQFPSPLEERVQSIKHIADAVAVLQAYGYVVELITGWLLESYTVRHGNKVILSKVSDYGLVFWVQKEFYWHHINHEPNSRRSG